jgi:uncharacterized protein YfaS (alpha-2-macroglobulin family)
MVAVSSRSEAAQNVPVRLTPQPAGHWRWIGTKTLLFQPDVRFPMATRFRVEVPAGTRSAVGGTLATTKSWEFRTPAPQLDLTYPDKGPASRSPLMFVSFDQRIDPVSVIAKTRVQASGKDWKVRLATPSEIRSDQRVLELSQGAEAGRWLAFRLAGEQRGRPVPPLPPGATVDVRISSGLESLEGPMTTERAIGFSFASAAPLRIDSQVCDGHCGPGDGWTIKFNNPLDSKSFNRSQVSVQPTVSDLKASVQGDHLRIDGDIMGRTTYTITVAPGLKDRFGQTLAQAASLTFETGSADQSLIADKEGLVLLDPFGPRQYSVYSINVSSLRIRLYSAQPEDWSAFIVYGEAAARNGVEWHGLVPPGRLVYSKIVNIAADPDQEAETKIELGPGLSNGLGNVFVIAEPVPQQFAGPARSFRMVRRRLAPRTAPLRQGRSALFARPFRVLRSDEDFIFSWIQATNIGLDAFVDDTRLIGWASSLKDGSPLDNVTLQLLPAGDEKRTSADGTATFGLSPAGDRKSSLLVARKGSDVALLPSTPGFGYGGEGWHRKPPGDSLEWYCFDDRGMYRPGEEVHIKGWIRRVEAGPDGDVRLPGSGLTISYSVTDSRRNQIGTGTAAVNAFGGFDTVIKLPVSMNLGYATLKLKANGGDTVLDEREHYHGFQVQEFRRPEYEVRAGVSAGPHVLEGHCDVKVRAAYFAGGALPNTPVSWRVTSWASSFTPPNRSDFSFGESVPWWQSNYHYVPSVTMTFAGLTDKDGLHRLRIDFESVNPPRPYSVIAEASVTDMNRQTWAARTQFLVHPADLYVGLRSPRSFVQKGDPLTVEAIVTDLDGQAVAGRTVELRAVRLDSRFLNGEWKQVEADQQERRIVSGPEPVGCRFYARESGSYRITATVVDDSGRKNETSTGLWVSGPSASRPGGKDGYNDVEEDEVMLIPDHKDYRPGDTAEILVQPPFFPASGLLVVSRSGIACTERFEISGPSYTIRIPIKDSYIPNIHVDVELMGASEREMDDTARAVLTSKGLLNKVPKKPAYAKGSLTLSVPPFSRTLTVNATPERKEFEPGAAATIRLEVLDAMKRPASKSEIALVVVDEAILALTKYDLRDPISSFYRERPSDMSDHHARSDLLLASITDLIAPPGGWSGFGVGHGHGFGHGDGPGMGGGSAGSSPVFASGQTRTRTRHNFNPLAAFAASVVTDSTGRASVPFTLPDNLTRYRVMAVAVHGDKEFGIGESTLTARLPLMLRPSPPRFLNYGDRFELPVAIQNQTGSSQTVEVAVKATNAALSSVNGRTIVIPAGDRAEIRFPASAIKPGTARFEVIAAAGNWSDSAECEIPVLTPATTEAFATYGEIDSGAIAQPVQAPAGVIDQFGGLEVTTSSTEFASLTDAVVYMSSYPYECAEQLASRILSIAALNDVLAAFHSEGLPAPAELAEAVRRDLKRLEQLQNDDGGFDYWRRGTPSLAYLSVHVIHALERARLRGFNVPDETLRRGRLFLQNVERFIPESCDSKTRNAIVAYALYVRSLSGDLDIAKAESLAGQERLAQLSLESIGWLLPVFSRATGQASQIDRLIRYLTNRVEETAGTAHFTDSYEDGDHLLLHSSRRADAVVLDGLMTASPDADLIPKIVRGLLAHRIAGRWSTTQENSFVLLALGRYFSTYEKVDPDFTAGMWLGNSYAGGHQFSGRTTDAYQVRIPMRYISQPAKEQALVLGKDGPGRMYYRIAMRYAPAKLELAPGDYGFEVRRTYEPVDSPDDVRHEPDGTWQIRAGARVRVRVTMVAPARRYHVALVDPLPAGFEPMNSTLAITGAVPADTIGDKSAGARLSQSRAGLPESYRSRYWFQHQNLRDDRAEAFASLLWEGVYEYSYVARATTPGDFTVPPSKAEEMYAPETFGRGATDRVVIQ